MKKILIVFFIILIFCFCLPILFIDKFNDEIVSSVLENNIISENENTIENAAHDNSIEDNVPKEKYKYDKYATIKLLHTDTNDIKEIELDTYLHGVVSAEMPANFHIEALKAQSVVARTYTIYKILEGGKHENADICDDSTCCQAWISKNDRFERWDENEREQNWNKIVEAVDTTGGKVIVYNNSIINAFFHANSGGSTEIPINVWGGNGYPYLQVVETLGEHEYSQYSSEVLMTKEEFKNKILCNYSNFEINFDDENWHKILEYTDGGRVKKIKFGNIEMSGVDVRKLFGLKSANFTVSLVNDNILFSVIGYGHGVGMSQTGADYLAKNSYTYDMIINHYYCDIKIIDLNSY